MRAVITPMSNGLTRDSAVLLLIDHQVGPLWEPDAAALRREVAGFATAATRLGVPIILSAMSCDEWGPIVPELREAAPNALTIRRSVVNAWTVPRLRRAVEATGRRHLIIAGVSLEGCVACAALAAAECDYRVYVALDVCGHARQHTAIAAVSQMLRAGVTVTNASPLLVEMVSSSSDSAAADVLALAVRHRLPSPPAISMFRARFAGDAA